MKAQKNETIAKLVKETKSAANHQVLHDLTVIDVVAITPGGNIYIFEMTIGQARKAPKKPGVQYLNYQKGVASFPGAIRREYTQ